MAYYAKINKKTKQIINFEESTSEIVEIKERAEKPQPKVGFDFIEKVKQLEDGSYTTEWAEVERELNEQEKILKRLSEVESGQLSVMEAIAEIHEQEGGA